MKKIFPGIFFFMFLLLNKTSYSQLPMYDWKSVKNISTLQGLPSNFTDCLLQDRKGFLWFVTYNGTVRYDGMNFKKYEFDINNSNSINPDWFGSIVEDKDGGIWITANNSGVYELNPATDKIIHHLHQPGNTNSIADDQVISAVVDSAGLIWICSFGGLNSFDKRSRKFKTYFHNDKDSTSISHNQLWSMCMDASENLWIATAVGFDCFDTHACKVRRHIKDSSIVNLKIKQDRSLVVTRGSHNTIWMICKNTGVWGYDTKEEKFFRHFFHKEKDTQSIYYNSVQNVYEDRYGNVWMSGGEGIDIWESSTGKIINLNKIIDPGRKLSGFSNMMEDRSGKLWIATGGDGIASIDPVQKKFHTLPDEAINNKPMSAPDVFTLLGMDANRILVTNDNAAYIYDTKKNTFTQFKLPYHGRELTSEGFIAGSHLDNKGMLFLGSAIKLITYDTATKAIHIYEHNIQDSTTLSELSCTDIICDRKGRYWCAAYGGGLDRFFPETGTFKAYKVHAGTNSISTNSILNIYEDSKGILCLGSTNGGLIRFDPDTEIFAVYRHDSKNRNTVSNDNVEYFYEAKNGLVYFTTQGGGLNVFDPSTHRFRAFTTSDGFSSNIQHAIICGNDGKLWIGSDAGISSFVMPEDPFDMNSKIYIRNYNVNDGLPCNEIMFGSVFKDADGLLYFGTACGKIIYFNPGELKNNPFVPPVYITEFSLFNTPVIPSGTNNFLKTGIELTKEITLSYKENVIAFSFAALNYIHPENNHYAYMLENFDKNWIYADASKRFANYTNLEAGTYFFKVKASNNDGVWNEVPATLKLIVTPPFWKTWWFRFLIITAVVLAGYSLYRFRLQQLLKIQDIRNKISSDLHDDIGSTLNSISVYSEVAKQKSKESIHELDMIGESSRKVMDAMSDIVWTINSENDSFEKIIFRMRSLTHQLMKAKKIEYTFEADDGLNLLKLPMQTRKNFYLIFKEAVNNLVKYSKASRAAISLKGNKNDIILVVRDNGIGFDISNPSRGNGLQNMKRRATEIKAEITIESSMENGTALELRLKADR